MTDSTVIPFCLYHKVDLKNKSYQCYIATSTLVLRPDGTKRYECRPHPDPDWKLVSVFYAVNPLARPVPNGMQLFCAKRNPKWPHQTTSVELVYDVFDDYVDGTYFFTYTTPVPNATPLYIWIKDDSAFADFSNSSPPEDLDTPIDTHGHDSDVSVISHTSNWGGATINPIYVLHPTVVGSDYTKVDFMCNNGSCLPKSSEEWKKKSRQEQSWGWTGPDIFNPSAPTTPQPLHECLINCNQLVRSKNGGGEPQSLIDIVRSEWGDLPPIRTQTIPSTPGLPVWSIGVIIIVVISLIVGVCVGVHDHVSMRRKRR